MHYSWQQIFGKYYHLHCSSCSLLCWNQNCYHKLHQSVLRKKLCFVWRSWSMPALTSGVQHCGFVFHLTEASRCTVCVLMISDIPICAAEGRFHIIKSLFYIYKKQLRGLATIATKCFFLFFDTKTTKAGPFKLINDDEILKIKVLIFCVGVKWSAISRRGDRGLLDWKKTSCNK